MLPNHDQATSLMEENPLYLSDLLTGIFAALALRRESALSLRNNRFDRAMEMLGPDLSNEAATSHLKLRFRIKTHPIHRDSEAIHQALYEAAQRDLISLDNPEFQNIRLKISAEDAPAYLSTLPGTAEMYERLANKLLSYYQQV